MLDVDTRIFDFDFCARPTDEASINIEVVNSLVRMFLGAFRLSRDRPLKDALL